MRRYRLETSQGAIELGGRNTGIPVLLTTRVRVRVRLRLPSSIDPKPAILKYTRPRFDKINNLKLMTTISFSRNTNKSITYDVLVYIVTFNQFSATLQLPNL